MTAAPATPVTVPVTVIVAARNESANIAACIDSVRWADEVIVADHGSSDDTTIQAVAAGATILDGAGAPTIGALRNGAIAAARNAWVLVVDADERATASLAEEVRGVTAQAERAAYRVPRRNFFIGREIRHGGWERDRPVRLFRSALRYDASRVHESVPAPDPGELRSALLHYPYGSLDEYFEKFSRYSRWWAEDRWARGKRASALAIVFRPPARFFKMYFLRLGFLDGGRGVVLAALAAASVLAKYVRLWAMHCES